MLASLETLWQWSTWLNTTYVTDDGKIVRVSSEPLVDGLKSCGEYMRIQCRKIENEINERYFELPLDADGAPIRIGDGMIDIRSSNDYTVRTFLRVVGVSEETFTAYREDEGGYRSQNVHEYRASDHVHCIEAKVRDILSQLVCEAEEYGSSGEPVHEVVAKYASRLRLIETEQESG
jgi:plasmid stability protein